MEKTLKHKSSYKSKVAIAVVGVALTLMSGQASANEFIDMIVDVWSMVKDYVLPIVAAALCVGGGYLIYQNQGKLISSMGLTLVAIGFMIFGPTLFGFGASK